MHSVMKRSLWPVCLLAACLLMPGLAHGQEATTEFEVLPEDAVGPAPVVAQAEEFYRGEVVEILEERQEEFGLGGTRPFSQKLKVKLLDGPRTGEEVVIDYGFLVGGQKLEVGERVVVVTPNDTAYIFDRYRLPALSVILGIFVMLAIIFAGWRGLTSLLGLGASVLVLALFVVPQIMAGKNPLLISLIGALAIALISIYLAHGVSRRTTVAVVSTLITIALAIGLAQLFVAWANLMGTGSEEAFYLQTSPVAFINLKGLLLGGIIIGALGVLDDITTAQAAAVFEIWRAKPTLSRRELFRRGMAVGREHITSLINTLALAYVGASFPALLLFTVYQRPWWVVTNTETITEEIIRTLVGSTALMIAVPITTLLAAYWLPRAGAAPGESDLVSHTHSHV